MKTTPQKHLKFTKKILRICVKSFVNSNPDSLVIYEVWCYEEFSHGDDQ